MPSVTRGSAARASRRPRRFGAFSGERLLPTLVLGLALCPTLRAQESQVNSYTTDTQNRASVARNSNGRFVVVWTSFGSNGSDNDYYSIQGRRFNASGQPLGGQFQVNTYTRSYQVDPAVAINDNGRFVVVWASDGSDGNDDFDYSIQGRIYQANGTPLGGQFQVNTNSGGDQVDPAVAINDAGDFVVAWETPGIQAQFFLANGTPLAGQFQVHDATLGGSDVDVAMKGDGTLVIVWRGYSKGTDTSSVSIQGRVYDSDGVALDDQFQVNTYTPNAQQSPAVAMRSDGRFVVVWNSIGSNGGDTSGGSIHGQLFSSSGSPIFGQFQVNTYTTDQQIYPDVAMDSEGDFLVVWESFASGGSDTSFSSIQTRLYASNGAPRGDQFQVNLVTTYGQRRPSAAASGDGDFVVVWDSYGSFGTDDSSTSIQASRPVVFLDGFESGGTASWSAAVP